MFRVRLPSGEEAVYRSIEELALGISSGVVSEQAEIFHSTNQQWLPIARHPQFEAARERAAVLVASGPGGDPPPPPPAEVGAAEPGGPHVYQMVSYSARELAERRRPRWRQHAVTVAAALLFLASIAIAIRPDRSAFEEAVWSHRLRSESPSRRPAGAVPGTSADQLKAPYNLANRLSRAQAAAAQELADSAQRIGLSRLLHPARLSSVDSLQRNLDRLARFGPSVAAYRTTVRQLWTAYRDTSQALAQTGAWDRLDVQEWRVRVSSAELRRDAAQADSLAMALRSLFALLSSQPEQLKPGSPTISLAGDSAGRAYDRLRADIRRLRLVDYQRERRIGLPLQMLLNALAPDSLPPRRP